MDVYVYVALYSNVRLIYLFYYKIKRKVKGTEDRSTVICYYYYMKF